MSTFSSWFNQMLDLIKNQCDIRSFDMWWNIVPLVCGSMRATFFSSQLLRISPCPDIFSFTLILPTTSEFPNLISDYQTNWLERLPTNVIIDYSTFNLISASQQSICQLNNRIVIPILAPCVVLATSRLICYSLVHTSNKGCNWTNSDSKGM